MERVKEEDVYDFLVKSLVVFLPGLRSSMILHPSNPLRSLPAVGRGRLRHGDGGLRHPGDARGSGIVNAGQIRISAAGNGAQTARRGSLKCKTVT